MLKLNLGGKSSYCDGVSRRSFLQAGAGALAALGMPAFQQARASANPTRRTSVILLWLDGGPGHMDMYDMKPDAPEEYRGLWKPIRSNVVGMDVTELFPRQARHADKFAILRSLYHDTGDHFAGGHRVLTTKDMGVSGVNNGGRFPGIGSIVSREVGPRRAGMPAYVGVPYAMSIGLRPGYFGASMLGPRYNPFETSGDPNAANFQVQNLNLASGLTLDKLEDRRTLQRHFDLAQRGLEQRADVQAMDRYNQEAYEFVTGPAAREAFAIHKEDTRLRDRYGRHNWGQSTLLARRLVEFGTTFVAVHFGGWDHHWNLQQGYVDYLPRVDSCVASLLEDLDDRGMLDSTLVVLCGEFSRTPKMNNGLGMGTPGRDHWGNSMFCFLAGGGIKGGQVVGATDRLGTRPSQRPATPSNLHATIYQLLGIDPKLQITDHSGRPVSVLDDPAPIQELL